VCFDKPIDFSDRMHPMRSFAALLLALLFLPAAVFAQTLERIRDSGEIKLGYRTDAAPLSFESAEGRPQGYSPIVCFALAERLAKGLGMSQLDIVFVKVDVDNRFEKVANGEIDLLCGAATITLERRTTIDFSIPTYVDGAAVMLQADAPSSLEGLAGKKIGVRAGTTTEQGLRNTLEAQGLTADVVTFDNHNDAMAAMESGDIQGYFADQSILMNLYLQSAAKDKIKVFDQILTVEKHGLALAKGDDDFRLAVDASLSEMFRDGTMEQAFRKALPGVEPGAALGAMYLLSPILP
jgi:polar amino acid transport system substrate-binding protein/glutamate/aspartate transport system substrate-binding protein